MKISYIAVWTLITITTVFFLVVGDASPLTITVLILMLLLLSLEALWQISFGELLRTENNQVKSKNLVRGGK